MRFLTVLLLAMATGWTSTSQPGWRGSDAEPFDGARALCEQQTSGQDHEAFDVCMASKGWRRAE